MNIKINEDQGCFSFNKHDVPVIQQQMDQGVTTKDTLSKLRVNATAFCNNHTIRTSTNVKIKTTWKPTLSFLGMFSDNVQELVE